MAPVKHRIFVSHSHLDNDFGTKLAQDLRRVLADEYAAFQEVLETFEPYSQEENVDSKTERKPRTMVNTSEQNGRKRASPSHANKAR